MCRIVPGLCRHRRGAFAAVGVFQVDDHELVWGHIGFCRVIRDNIGVTEGYSGSYMGCIGLHSAM